MPKRFTIILLGFLAGVLGNLIAGYVQQEVWSNVFTNERLIVTGISIALMLLFVAMLETERALSWNWRWHRFWYLRELLKNWDLRRWETDFARLEMAPGRRKISSAEVIAEGRRQDMVEVLRELIIGRREKTPRALVLGEPGSGKTTGLERLTLDLACYERRRLGIGCKIPVLLRLANFQKGDLLDYVGTTMEQGTKRSSGEILGKGIKKLIKQGRVVLLCDALKDSDCYVGRHAAEALAKIGDPRAVKPLIVALESDLLLSEPAAEALGKIGDVRAVEPLIAALNDSDYGVRVQAAEALRELGDPRALPELERVAREDKSKTPWGDSVAEVARLAAEKIRQRMAGRWKVTV